MWYGYLFQVTAVSNMAIAQDVPDVQHVESKLKY